MSEHGPDDAAWVWRGIVKLREIETAAERRGRAQGIAIGAAIALVGALVGWWLT